MIESEALQSVKPLASAALRSVKPLHLEVAEAMSEVAASLQTPMDLDETLALITRSAADTIPGIVEASISITTRSGEIETLAPTGPLVLRADFLQYELGEGPCLDAALEQPVVVVEDLANDQRWPDFGPKAAALGFGSQVAFQFEATGPNTRGALNLYAGEPHAIDHDSVQLGAMFASQIAVALGWARQDESMNEALATRNLIGQAVGILMERYKLDSERAFAFLVRLSQTSNTKLREIAGSLVAQVNDSAER
jgi:ANTAR domain-containing protein/GAF domain-containing protein